MLAMLYVQSFPPKVVITSLRLPPAPVDQAVSWRGIIGSPCLVFSFFFKRPILLGCNLLSSKIYFTHYTRPILTICTRCCHLRSLAALPRTDPKYGVYQDNVSTACYSFSCIY